jgi:hypothetical protein
MTTEDAFAVLVLRPHSKVTISSDSHSLRLTNANDLWYSGGGAYQPWTVGDTGRSVSGQCSLANVYDTSAEYRVNRHMTFTAYMGCAQGKAVMHEIYPTGVNGQFGSERGYRYVLESVEVVSHSDALKTEEFSKYLTDEPHSAPPLRSRWTKIFLMSFFI